MCLKKYTGLSIIIVFLVLVLENNGYEKTLRKMVRDRAKMVQRPFSEVADRLKYRNTTHILPQTFMHAGFAQVKSVIHKKHRPKISTILSSVETSKGRSTYSRINIDNKENLNPYEIRLVNNAFANISHALQDKKNVPEFQLQDHNSLNSPPNIAIKTYYQIPQSNFFLPLDDDSLSTEDENATKNTFISISEPTTAKASNLLVQSVNNTKKAIGAPNTNENLQDLALDTLDVDMEKADFTFEPISTKANLKYVTSSPILIKRCNKIMKAKTDIDFQTKFSNVDIEPPWVEKKCFWNNIYESRYESLMRSSKWPSLKVILIPRTHVDTIWKKSFEDLHNDTVHKIIFNMIKKLQYYPNMTFVWNEVSHLSQWWKTANQKSRAGLRRLVNEGRLEITTGGWVETDGATSHLFGMLHQLTEGHQWLRHNLNYYPKVAWTTNSVTHSPTLTYLLSASNIPYLVMTNIHFSLEQYLAEYQHSDFVWIQNWDNRDDAETELNKSLNKIGIERYPKHAVLTHFLPFNSGGFRACGPDGDICVHQFNFAEPNKKLDISSYNVQDKSEIILGQYSKTGTLSAHNVIMAPIGGPYRYENQNEFDYQFNNYKQIADFINNHEDIYKTHMKFGTPRDYFLNILERQKSYPKSTGDILNFADISLGTPAYWTGFFTSRPHLKMLLRRLHSTLRSTEILFSFALSYNALSTYEGLSDLFKRLYYAREVVARLQDRNVVSGTLSSSALRYVQSQILSTNKDCWYIQEVAASLLTSTPGHNKKVLEKYVAREGEFVSTYKLIIPGDQIYIFNSLTQDRIEVVEIISRFNNLRVLDNNNKNVPIQINPIWKYAPNDAMLLSRQFYKIIFTVVLAPMALTLYTVSDTYDQSNSAATIYCIACEFERAKSTYTVPFNIRNLESGDIQIENYKHRLIIDEYTGFLKTVVEKATNREKLVQIDYGAFKSSNINSGMFLFNTNVTRPLVDILAPYRTGSISKKMIIISGLVATEVTTIYGKMLQHTIKIFNMLHTFLDDVISIESKIDYDTSPKNRELEVFLTIQTAIANGNPPQLFIDNNGFQYTPRTLNISRRIESNMYPITNMLFIQDNHSRLTLITDHAQGVTTLQEGQIVVMLDRRVLYNDNRGTGEGLADNIPTMHTHYILLENVAEGRIPNFDSGQNLLESPSFTAIYFTNVLNYNLDVFMVDRNQSSLVYYTFLPLLKTTFPCDVSLINYRLIFHTVYKEKYLSNTALLMLHRLGYSCEFGSENKEYCNSDSTVTLMSIFRGLKEIYHTNVVGTTKGVSVKSLNLADFPPMEIITLIVHF